MATPGGGAQCQIGGVVSCHSHINQPNQQPQQATHEATQTPQTKSRVKFLLSTKYKIASL